MSRALDADLARAVARDLATAAGVELVTPESLPIVRDLAYLSVAAVTPLTRDEARQRVSLYVPGWVPEAATVLAAAVPVRVPLDTSRPLVIVGDLAWADPAALCGTIAHELSHHRRYLATRGACGLACALTWGAAYAAVPAVRVWEESSCYTCTMTARVILAGASVDDAQASALRSLESIYAATPEALTIGRRVIASCAESLRAGQLHGSDTTVHDVLRALSARNVDLGEWEKVLW